MCTAAALSHTLKADFQYRHRNPYHERPRNYGQFVLLDREGEQFPGRWQRGVFKNRHPIAVEMGPGHGHFMLKYCRHNPSRNFVGIDYRFKRSFQLAKKIHRHGLCNVRYQRARGEWPHFIFGPEEVERIFCFFLGPWPKSRHHKKRLLHPTFLDSIHWVLRPGGEWFIKTDHDEYTSRIVRPLEGDPRWSVELATADLRTEYPGHFLSAYRTKFEKIFLSQGIPIKAWILRKVS